MAGSYPIRFCPVDGAFTSDPHLFMLIISWAFSWVLSPDPVPRGHLTRASVIMSQHVWTTAGCCAKLSITFVSLPHEPSAPVMFSVPAGPRQELSDCDPGSRGDWSWVALQGFSAVTHMVLLLVDSRNPVD